jgi:uncharacterized protein YjiS (DUF1127 family)
MTYQSTIDHFVDTEKHDRSLISYFARPTLPLMPSQAERPALPLVRSPGKTDLRWLDGLHDPAALKGIDQPWWRLVLPALGNAWILWRQRSRMRHELAKIDAHTLRDAGISPGAAAFEAAQPFWSAPIVLRDTEFDRAAD